MLATIGSLCYVSKCAILRTFTHEFVHFIEKHNDTEYEAFRDIVFEEMREKGMDPEDLIDAYRMQHPEATDDEASREVVAEAMTDILPQSQFLQKLAQKEPGLFKKLLERLKAFIKDIKDHFASIGYTASPEVAAVTEDIDGVIRYAEKIVEAFDRIAVKAVENYKEGVPAQKTPPRAVCSIVQKNTEQPTVRQSWAPCQAGRLEQYTCKNVVCCRCWNTQYQQYSKYNGICQGCNCCFRNILSAG